MKSSNTSFLFRNGALCAVLIMLVSGCAKEQLVAPTGQQGAAGIEKCNGNGTTGGGNDGGGYTDPDKHGISDDGDNQADNERGHKKAKS